MTVAQNVDLIEAEDRRKTKEIVDKINAQVRLNEAIEFLNDQTFSHFFLCLISQIADQSYGRLFAVVAMEFHQHKITAGDLLCLNFDIGAPNGAKVRLEKALLVGSKDFTLFGRPLLPR